MENGTGAGVIMGYIGDMLGLYRENGKYNGNYYNTIGYIGVI